MARIGVYTPQIQVPVLEAPRAQRIDVSSAGEYAAAQQREIEDKQTQQSQITQLNDAQIGASKAFGDLDDELRRTPWDQKTQLFNDRSAQIRAQYLDPISDQKVRQSFEPEFERMLGTYQAHTREDAFKGQSQHNIAQASDAADMYARQAAFARSPQERQLAVENGAAVYHNLVAGGFINEEQMQKAVSGFLGNVDLVSAQQAIDADPWKARKALDDPASFPNLDPLQTEQLKGHARIEADRRDALARAEANRRSVEASQDAQDLVRSDLSSRQLTGKALSDPQSLATIKAGLTPKQFEAYTSAATKADGIYQATGDMRTLPSADIQARVAALQPQGGEADFSDRQAAYQAAATTAHAVLTERQRDPGAAVQAYPGVQAAWAAAGASNKPADWQVAMRSSAAAQTALGIPADKQRLMPDQLARAIAGSVNGAPPERAAQELQARAAQFGPYWNQAFKQMSQLLNGHARVAATLDDPNNGAMLIEGARQPVEALRKAAGVPPGQYGILPSVIDDQNVKALATSLSQRAGGSQTAIQVTQSIEVLALERMRRFGETQDQATSRAIKSIVDDKYGFANASGLPFRVPLRDQQGKPIDTSGVEDGALATRSGLSGADLDLPRGVPGALPQDTRAAYLSAVQRNGYWVTNDSETGAILYDGDRSVPVSRKGKPVELTWEQLRAAGVTAQTAKRNASPQAIGHNF